MKKIRIAIVGVGNCASSLYQGICMYKDTKNVPGLLRENIGGYTLQDIEVVTAFDVDQNKVGKHLSVALFTEPNCTPVYYDNIHKGPIVEKGPLLDGIGDTVKSMIQVSKERDVCVQEVLKKHKVDILINYLPVGSQEATEYYANECLECGVSFLNCIPVFIASNPVWEQKFREKGIPIIGDDMKSQYGASILSQVLQDSAVKRGIKVNAHIQRNIGGNTDFLNMMSASRVVSKKKSKENVIQSQTTDQDTFIHAGPSEYISHYKDTKIANISLEMEGFLGSQMKLDLQLNVVDSPNSAGVVCDAIRYLKIARDIGLRGSIRGPSAFTQKTPPQHMSLDESIRECDILSNRSIFYNL